LAELAWAKMLRYRMRTDSLAKKVVKR